LELTAVSAIVYFLGLLFGFQRPSRLLLSRLHATVFSLLGSTLFNFGAASSISKRLFCQAAVAAPFHRFIPFGFNTAPSRFVSSFREGRGTYFASALRVNLLRRLFFPPRPGSVACATSAVSWGSGFYHHRVGSQPASSTSYFVFHFFRPGDFVASATSPFRPRGAASITAASGVNSVV
ncbi:hypothetical protein, partial [Archangium sp.]|uniref:hypothetical protein n=1 Tax=Archangium sp. TaxID=1872627 RepID=UPI003899EE3C